MNSPLVSTFKGSRYVISKTVSVDYSYEDQIEVVNADATSGPIIVTLPLIAVALGRLVTVRKIDSSGNTVTIQTAGSDSYQGGSNVVLGSQWAVLSIDNDGTQWYTSAGDGGAGGGFWSASGFGSNITAGGHPIEVQQIYDYIDQVRIDVSNPWTTLQGSNDNSNAEVIVTTSKDNGSLMQWFYNGGDLIADFRGADDGGIRFPVHVHVEDELTVSGFTRLEFGLNLSGDVFNVLGNSGTVFTVDLNGKSTYAYTDNTGAPGDNSANTPSGKCQIAATASSVTITNSLVTSNTIVDVSINQASEDTTLTRLHWIVGPGSFTVSGNAAATAAVQIAWTIKN